MTMRPSPELRPNPYDALVVLAVLALAALCALRFWLPRADAGDALTAAVAVDGAVLDRLPLAADTERVYEANGYTLQVTVSGGSVRVSESDCPTRDCVRTGAVSRPGESIVCLPARLVITLEGGEAAFDAAVG